MIFMQKINNLGMSFKDRCPNCFHLKIIHGKFGCIVHIIYVNNTYRYCDCMKVFNL